ncbi:phosphoesterase family-domain-containing protein, partial [Obelidium mucronatum]
MDNIVHKSVEEGPAAPKKWFDRIIITFLENTDYDQAISHFEKLNEAPHFGTLLTNYHGVTHPSQPNYVALVTGDLLVKSDVVVDIAGPSIVDLLEAKNVTWGAYSEEYPDDWEFKDGKAFTDNHVGRYVRRHNALASMTSVQNDPKRARNIKSAEAFKRELEAGTLPEFILYTPNQDNNAHDTNTAYAARYIKDFYIPMMSHSFFTSQRTLFVLTFDESASYVFGGNRVATWLLGTATPAGASDNTEYNHYDTLKTVELNWGLGDLGRNDVNAVGFGKLLRPYN